MANAGSNLDSRSGAGNLDTEPSSQRPFRPTDRGICEVFGLMPVTADQKMLAAAGVSTLANIRAPRLHRLHRHLLQHHILVRAIVSTARDFRDLINNVLSLDDLAEDGVLPGQPSRWYNCDEELRPICVRTCIGHS